MIRFALLFALVLLGSCDMETNAERVVQHKKEDREFYLSCVETVTRSSYGRNAVDLMEECRRAATQL
jgi:hypothetical protein